MIEDIAFFADPMVAVVEIIFLLELIIEFKHHLVLFMMLSTFIIGVKVGETRQDIVLLIGIGSMFDRIIWYHGNKYA